MTQSITERRKVTQNGPSSLAISLPSKWLKKNDIKKGDCIDIEEQNNNLILKTTTSTTKKKKAQISFINLNSEIEKDILTALHQKGYDEVEIQYESETTKKNIYSLLHNLDLGFEIISQQNHTITLQNLSEPNHQENNILKNIFKLTSEYSYRIKTLIEQQEEKTESYLLHELTLNRISNLLKRTLIKTNQPNAPLTYTLINTLKDLAYELTTLLNQAQENEITKETIETYSKITENILNTHKLFYNFSLTEYNKIKTNINQVIKNNNKNIQEQILQNLNKKNNDLLQIILTIHI